MAILGANNRFWHTGPAVVYAVMGRTPADLVNYALTPANWMANAFILGTCERYPQIQVQQIREEVRNDLGGDSVIAKPFHGEKAVVQCELNRWHEVNLDNLRANFCGQRIGRTGLHEVVGIGTMVDIPGNSCGILIYYPDSLRRPHEGMFLPMATLDDWAPVKIGNRTAAVSIRMESNTGFAIVNGNTWVSFDYVTYPNGTGGLDNLLVTRSEAEFKSDITPPEKIDVVESSQDAPEVAAKI
jgi:hypothetical protein